MAAPHFPPPVRAPRRWALPAALLVLLVLAGVLLLPGCSGQDEVIGEGEAELVFRNQGDTSVPLTVTWSEDGRVRRQEFTVLIGGRVTLRVIPRLGYDIEMRPRCSSASAADSSPAPPQDEILDLRTR